ncbi:MULTISPECIES: YhgE/Pip domain-containing protein [unclassified Streptococcus]|uniref:YhgE/Pip domain-containing protein n=1 Tax=unclassified Streptococcus TaxID=2608887 RepID=UPI001071B923|nr:MULTISPECIES: YhgE/Pip domain-containing protein [unclassified Streptococcus]MBF0787090.1 YhgE/Pip domain-containing protein [Streptococcus sp. 19428wC2_LYSM12]MCQ9211353.1 YhgE/Pip domain-containing protein [Streptococcus sp. B01]MCQ9214665.1 YhgE/Pip domain-containing protein [Streptococcus sp. O1]TFV05977.1 YhgE/Pip domain-containing protein [Streptococcus sp. LYSM12]
MLEQMKHILKKPSLWIVMIGVACIPALYNLSFLTSMWDPYGNVKNLPVAVVNKDLASEFQGKDLKIGQDMVKSMKESENLDFHFVSSEDAEKGLEAGTYYMVVTLPADLSQKAASLLTDKPEQLKIDYQTSKGHSFVAAKMGESAMNKLQESVSENITQTYTRAVFSSMSQLQAGLGKAADGGQQLNHGSQALVAGSQTLANGLGTLATSTQTLSEGADQLHSGLVRYTDGVAQATRGGTGLVNGLLPYTNGVESLAGGASQLDDKSAELLAGVKQLQSGQDQIQELVAGANRISDSLSQLATATTSSKEQEASLVSLIQGLSGLQEGINELNTHVSGLTVPNLETATITTSLQTIGAQAQTMIVSSQADKEASIVALQATSAYQTMDANQQAELVAAIEAHPSTTVAQAQAILQELASMQNTLAVLGNTGGMAGQVAGLKEGVQQLAAGANQALPGATMAITELSGGLHQANSALSQLASGSQTLAGGVGQLQSALASGSDRLGQGVTLYTDAVAQLSNGANQLVKNNGKIMAGASQIASGLEALDSNSASLVTGVGRLADGSKQLQAGTDKLQSGGQELVAGVDKLQTGTDSLAGSLSQAHEQLSLVAVERNNADMVSKPVTLSHQDKDKVPTNGVGMAPYMVSVALMVVALSTNVIFAKRIDGKEYSSRSEWASNKLVINGTIATLASVILYATLHLIGIDSSYPLATFGLILLAAWTFMALVTALIGWNNHLGSFAALLLLLLQLGSSAGTYPIELSPNFFQKVQPYLPMTYTVAGLRQTISMGNHISHQVTILSLFLIGFMALGLLIFRPVRIDAEK